MNEKEAIKLFKELGIVKVNFNFNCGGDSMGDTDIVFEKENGETVENEDLKNYFDDETYKNVEFYVNSDGHYMGESGTVEITLDEDDEEPFFNYCKIAQSEFNETITSIFEAELTKEEIEFINKNVLNINGGEDGGCNINYKHDFILSDEEEKLVSELEEKIYDFAEGFTPVTDNDVQEWFTFTTNSEWSDVKELTTTENGLMLVISNSVITYSDSD